MSFGGYEPGGVHRRRRRVDWNEIGIWACAAGFIALLTAYCVLRWT